MAGKGGVGMNSNGEGSQEKARRWFDMNAKVKVRTVTKQVVRTWAQHERGYIKTTRDSVWPLLSSLNTAKFQASSCWIVFTPFPPSLRLEIQSPWIKHPWTWPVIHCSYTICSPIWRDSACWNHPMEHRLCSTNVLFSWSRRGWMGHAQNHWPILPFTCNTDKYWNRLWATRLQRQAKRPFSSWCTIICLSCCSYPSCSAWVAVWRCER